MAFDALLLALCVVAEPPSPGAAPRAPAPPPPVDTQGFRAAPPALAGRSAGRGLRVGVPEPAVLGDASAREIAVLSQALVTEVRKLEGVTAIGVAEIREMLTQEYRRQMLGCQVDHECLAEIAGALGVDELISSQLVVDKGTSTFTVSRIDMRTTRVTANAQKRLARRKGGEEVLGSVGEVVAALFPARPLREGQTRGVAKQAARWLNPPPVPRWVFFSTAGAAALFAAGGVAYGVASNSTATDYNALNASPGPKAGSELARLEDKMEAQRARSAVLFGVAGGLAVAAGIEAFFTDWHDDRAAVTVTPAGARVTVRF